MYVVEIVDALGLDNAMLITQFFLGGLQYGRALAAVDFGLRHVTPSRTVRITVATWFAMADSVDDQLGHDQPHVVCELGDASQPEGRDDRESYGVMRCNCGAISTHIARRSLLPAPIPQRGGPPSPLPLLLADNGIERPERGIPLGGGVGLRGSRAVSLDQFQHGASFDAP